MAVFQSTVECFDNPVYGHHFKVPENIASTFIDGANRRVICRLNGSLELRAALMPSQEGWYILLNKNNRNQLGVSVGGPLEVAMKKDHSEFGMEMPDQLQLILGQNEQAEKAFYSLTKGKQRSLIYIVNKVKNPESRLKKALAIGHHLEEAKGKLDFKRLNELIKYYNNS